MRNSYCTDSGGAEKMRFGRFRGFIPGGSRVEIDVPSGSNRTIWLAGLKAQNGACINLAPGIDPDGPNLSEPHIIAKTIRNLPPGNVAIDLTRVLDTNEKFVDCSFTGQGGGSGGGGLDLGNGADGSIAVSGVKIPSATDVVPGRTFSAARRITNIDTTAGRILQLASSYTAVDFNVGDEVLWVVNAAGDNPSDNGSFAGPDSVCGNGNSNTLHRGKYGFARVTSISGAPTQIEIDRPIIGYSTVNNAALAQSATNASSFDFCKMQLMRVPNIDNMTVSAGGATFTANSYNYSSGTGGILAMKIKGTLTLNDYVIFSAWGNGFKGGNPGGSTGYAGDASSGAGIIGASSNDTGGGGGNSITPSHGGGGAGIGAGGHGSGSPNGGAPINWCFGPCKPSEKLLLGSGGGGGDGPASGGNGGGVILLFANNIVANTYNISVDARGAYGNAGSSVSGGGGGGGSALVIIKTISGTSGQFDSAVDGGDGVGGGSGSGVGGSGLLEFHTCNRSAYTATPGIRLFSNLGVNGSATNATNIPFIDGVGTPLACNISALPSP